MAEQNEKISFHTEYEEEESAWKKVTPVGKFDSPEPKHSSHVQHQSSTKKRSNRVLKPNNLSEGECSSEND